MMIVILAIDMHINLYATFNMKQPTSMHYWELGLEFLLSFDVTALISDSILLALPVLIVYLVHIK